MEGRQQLAIASEAFRRRRAIENRPREETEADFPVELRREVEALRREESVAYGRASFTLEVPIPDEYRALWLQGELEARGGPRNILRYLYRREILGEPTRRRQLTSAATPNTSDTPAATKDAARSPSILSITAPHP